MARGCLGVLLLPLAGLVALIGALAVAAESSTSRGLGWVLIVAALFAAVTAARSVHGGLRQTARGRSANPATIRPMRGAAAPLMALVLVIGAGTLASLAGPAGLAALIPLHILAALLPARVITRHVGTLQGGAPPRAIGRGLAWGGLGATAVAFAGELIVGTALALVVWLALGTTPGARESVQGVIADLFAALTAATPMASDSLEVPQLGLLLRPSIVTAAVGLLGLAGPLIEELAKLAGVVALRPRTRPQAFLFGVAVGAGFGVLEALLTGSAAIGPAWGLAIVARAAATLMHATTCGIAAVGWFELANGEARRGAARIALAVALHAIWNLGVLGAVLATAAVAEGVGPSQLELVALGSPLAVTAVFAFVLLAFTGMARRFGIEAGRDQPVVESVGR